MHEIISQETNILFFFILLKMSFVSAGTASVDNTRAVRRNHSILCHVGPRLFSHSSPKKYLQPLLKMPFSLTID